MPRVFNWIATHFASDDDGYYYDDDDCYYYFCLRIACCCCFCCTSVLHFCYNNVQLLVCVGAVTLRFPYKRGRCQLYFFATA